MTAKKPKLTLLSAEELEALRYGVQAMRNDAWIVGPGTITDKRASKATLAYNKLAHAHGLERTPFKR